MPEQPQNPLTAFSKAETIGPARVGDRYIPGEAQPSLWDLVKQYVLGGYEMPRSVQAKDPYAIQAWRQGNAPEPSLVIGSTEPVKGPIKAGTGGLYDQLYSRLSRAFESPSVPEKMHPNKALSHAQSNAAKEEITWRQFPEFLKSKGDEVTKGEIQGHLASNPIKLKETVRKPVESRPGDPLWIGEGPHTKYGKYVQPGGQNYKETLIQLDNTPRLDVLDAKLKQNGRLEGPEIEEYNRLVNGESLPKTSPTTYRSSHWDEPNILVHTRSNERYLSPGGLTKQGESAKKALDELHFPFDTADQRGLLNDQVRRETISPSGKGTFLEEVQSDWHQQGKKEGYGKKPYKIEDLSVSDSHPLATGETLYTYQLPDGQTVGSFRIGAGQTETDARAQAFQRVTTGELGVRQESGVPDAPFKESWPDLALKRHLLEVAKDPEQSWLGWTTGKDQADRYNLSKHIAKLQYDPELQTLDAFDPKGNALDILNGGLRVPPDKIRDYVGQEVADKLLATPLPQRVRPNTEGLQVGRHSNFFSVFENEWKIKDPTTGEFWTAFGNTPEEALNNWANSVAAEQNSVHELSGLDLQTGGEGMKYFYDQLLPARMNKILKPFGGKVEQGELPTGRQLWKDFGGDTNWDNGVLEVRQADPETGELGDAVASVLPRFTVDGHGMQTNEQAQALQNNALATIARLKEQAGPKPETFSAWIAKLTPEMKQRIAKEGLPLLTALYLVYQKETGSNSLGVANPQQ